MEQLKSLYRLLLQVMFRAQAVKKGYRENPHRIHLCLPYEETSRRGMRTGIWITSKRSSRQGSSSQRMCRSKQPRRFHFQETDHETWNYVKSETMTSQFQEFCSQKPTLFLEKFSLFSCFSRFQKGWSTVDQPSRSRIQRRFRKEAQTQENWFIFKKCKKPQGCAPKSTLLVIENQGFREKRDWYRFVTDFVTV